MVPSSDSSSRSRTTTNIVTGQSSTVQTVQPVATNTCGNDQSADTDADKDQTTTGRGLGMKLNCRKRTSEQAEIITSSPYKKKSYQKDGNERMEEETRLKQLDEERTLNSLRKEKIKR